MGVGWGKLRAAAGAAAPVQPAPQPRPALTPLSRPLLHSSCPRFPQPRFRLILRLE